MSITSLIYPHFLGNYGLQVPLLDNHTEMDILDLYLTDEFYGLIVLETTRNAKQYFEEKTSCFNVLVEKYVTTGGSIFTLSMSRDRYLIIPKIHAFCKQ